MNEGTKLLEPIVARGPNPANAGPSVESLWISLGKARAELDRAMKEGKTFEVQAYGTALLALVGLKKLRGY